VNLDCLVDRSEGLSVVKDVMNLHLSGEECVGKAKSYPRSRR
jgi:hypothetical protein